MAGRCAVAKRTGPANLIGRYAGNVEISQDASRLGHRAAHINSTAGILDHDRVETLAAGVFTRIADAEIEGEPGDEHAGESAFAQIAGQPSMSLAVVLVERRVGVDRAVIAFAQ